MNHILVVSTCSVTEFEVGLGHVSVARKMELVPDIQDNCGGSCQFLGAARYGGARMERRPRAGTCKSDSHWIEDYAVVPVVFRLH